MVEVRRFPPPRTVEVHTESFIVRDAVLGIMVYVALQSRRSRN